MTLSMDASTDTEHEEASIADVCGKRLLRSAVVYGANASGKSNLISAMKFMQNFTVTSSRETQVEEEIGAEPFRLSTDCDNKPCRFEVVFIKDAVRFRYGFEVDKKAVHSEWLFTSTTARESELFVREGAEISFNAEKFKEGKGLVEKTRPNALFLSVVAQFNGEISGRVLKWFRDVRFISAIRNPALWFTVERMSDPKFAAQVLEMSKVADLAIEGLIPKITSSGEEEIPTLVAMGSKSVRQIRRPSDFQMKTQHKKFDASNEPTELVEFDLEKNESDGTKKYLSMTGPILDTLANGRVLMVDELDARLHPLLSRAIVQMFNTAKNKTNAQLIFATHDTNLLSRNFFRRDQVWFTEKDKLGATNLYSLSEFKVLILCEDEKTAPNYFLKFPVHAEDLIIEVFGTGANTVSLVREAIRRQIAAESAGNKYITVWVVFDRDSFPAENFNEAFSLAKRNGIRVAYANQCFELWYWLHFDLQHTSVSRSEYGKKLSTRLSRSYNKSDLTLYDELLEHQPVAIRNAKKLLSFYGVCNPEKDDPSTSVHLLVEYLNEFRR